MTYCSRNIISLAIEILLAIFCCTSVCADPVKNIRYYRVSDDRVVIYYDLHAAESSTISVEVSLDSIKNFTLKPHALSGDVGDGVTPGQCKRIIWEIHKDIEILPEHFLINVLAVEPFKAITTIDEKEKKTVAAFNIQSPIKLDGFLNEPVWEKAVPVSNFTQSEPLEGSPASENTEVKILYDTENLYIGVICYDKEPEKIIYNELKVDGALRDDDNFSIVLDTFHDNRGGFYFCTNPNGARLDGKIIGSGSSSSATRSSSTTSRNRDGSRNRLINDNWNGIWDVSAKITDNGWSAEICIPFKTLRFSSGIIQEWGINFQREIRRKNEEVLWCSWRRDDGLIQLTKAGTLTDLKNLERGSKIQFKPYVLGGLEKEENVKDENFKTGLDIKYPLTSDLTIDLTTFTDFAQIESDRTRINLTRFDLYYPEKREFFLEGAEIFEFGSRFTTPIYSRKIGITSDEEQVPILGGAKMTGKIGGYSIGLLNMQTDEEKNHPSTNYSVLRLKKDILESSSIGIYATHLYNTDKHRNLSYGADFSFSTNNFLNDKNLAIEGWIADNKTSGLHHGTRAGRFLIRYPNDLFYIQSSNYIVGENYQPEIGFIRRAGVKQYFNDIDFTPRPNIPFIRKLLFSFLDLYYVTDMNNTLESRSLNFTPFGFETTTNELFRFNICTSYEYLAEDFNIFNDVFIPRGVYTWSNYETEIETNPSRLFSVQFKSQWGDFYEGTRAGFETGCNVRLNKYLAFSSDITYNRLNISSRNFNTKEYCIRINQNYSTRLTSQTYIQWNNETKEADINFRVHFIPKIGSDIYLVYNHVCDGYQDYKTVYNTAISKIAYHIEF